MTMMGDRNDDDLSIPEPLFTKSIAKSNPGNGLVAPQNSYKDLMITNRLSWVSLDRRPPMGKRFGQIV